MASFDQFSNLSSDGIVENPCKPCTDSGLQQEATSSCVDCGELFCQKCLLDHNKFTAMRSHQIVDVSKHGVSKRCPDSLSMSTERCDIHHGKHIDMFCEDHDEVCCAACIAVQHRSCDKVKYIPEIASQCKETLKIQEVKAKAEKLLDSLNRQENSRNCDMTTLDNQKAESLKKIDDFEKRLIMKIMELTENTRGQVREKHQNCVDALKADLENIRGEKALVERRKRKLEANDEADSELFVGFKMCKKVVNSKTEILEGINDAFSHRSLKINLNTELYETLNFMASVKETFAGPAKYKANLCQKHNLDRPGDKNTCVITTACVLDNGDMLLSDYANSNIKRLDRNYTIVDSLELDGDPISISKISSSKAAVALEDEKKILIVNVDGGMKTEDSIGLRRKCYGTCFFEENLYVCLGGNEFSDGNGKIGVYDIHGKLQREYQKDSLGNFIFSSPIQIAVCPNGDRFFVTDREKGLLCLDQAGRVLWAFFNPSLEGCWALCSLPDSLFVSGLESRNILQVGFDGKLVETVLEGLKDRPYGIKYLAESESIVLGQDSDELLIYNLRTVDD